MKRTGLIQVYTGDGKGKTTAAIGSVIRATGAKLKVAIIFFFKRRVSCELNQLKKIQGVEFYNFFTQKKFVTQMNDKEKEKLRNEIKKSFELFKLIVKKKNINLIILDEISYPLQYGFISISEFIDLIKNKNKKTEIILTGRNMPSEIIELADLVTEMKKIKHPFDKGVKARKGFDY